MPAGRTFRLVTTAALASVLLAGCGGGSTPDTAGGAEPAPPPGTTAPTTLPPDPATDDRDWCALMPSGADAGAVLGTAVQDPIETLRLEHGFEATGNDDAYSVRCYYVAQGESLADHPLRGEFGLFPGDAFIDIFVGVDDLIWGSLLQSNELLPGDQPGPPAPADLGSEALFTTFTSPGGGTTTTMLQVRDGSYAVVVQSSTDGFDQLAELARMVLGQL